MRLSGVNRSVGDPEQHPPGILKRNNLLSASGDKNKGEQVYQQYCQVCHGPQGKDDGPLGMSLKPPLANPASEKIKSKPDSELLNTIRKGRGAQQCQAGRTISLTSKSTMSLRTCET